ncbi:MAG: M14 family metallopeptidase [Candidatus Sericytochromatia bacterium]
MKKIGKISSLVLSTILVGMSFACSQNVQQEQIFPNQVDSSISSSNEKGFIANRNFSETGYTILKIFYTNKKQIQTLNELGLDVWTVQNGFVIGQANQEVMRRLKLNTQLKIEMLSPKEGMSVLNTFDPQYHTYEETVTDLKGFASKYPNLAQMIDIGDTWEKKKGIANRDLWAMKITGKGDGAKKPGIVFFGNHHARELVTVEIPLKLINHLLENYGKNADITNMVDNTEIWIVPMVNPDGHTLAEKGQNWRKNKNDNKDMGAGSALGVDLNRNYGYQWNTGGSSGSTSSDTFHGKEAFSEPETQATRDFMNSHTNLKIMMSYHSFSNLILWPWGWSNDPSPDAKKFETIGGKLGANSGYKPEQASELYIASGITDDYAYGKLKLLSFTTEIGAWGDGFDPPYSKVEQFWKENLPNALYLIKLAGENPMNTEACFGPDIKSVSKSGSSFFVNFDQKYDNEVKAVEYFTSKPSAPGKGKQVNVDDKESFKLDITEKIDNNTVYIRAQGKNGKWGPITAVSTK